MSHIYIQNLMFLDKHMLNLFQHDDITKFLKMFFQLIIITKKNMFFSLSIGATDALKP